MDQETLRQAIQRIRDEMVCCDTYEQLHTAGFVEADYRALKRSSNYHAICHYGEWAARIVELMLAESASCHPDCITVTTHRTICPNADPSLPGLFRAAEDEGWEPCQPIGCDNGYHLAGCQFADTDEADTK